MLFCLHCSQLSPNLKNIVEPESGVTILNNMGNNRHLPNLFSGHKNCLFSKAFILRLNFKLLFRVHPSKFGKCLCGSTTLFNSVAQQAHTFLLCIQHCNKLIILCWASNSSHRKTAELKHHEKIAIYHGFLGFLRFPVLPRVVRINYCNTLHGYQFTL